MGVPTAGVQATGRRVTAAVERRRRRQAPAPGRPKVPGLTRATFKGGYTWSLWRADVATGEANEIWHNQPGDTTFAAIGNLRLAGDHLVFRFNVGGGRGADAGHALRRPPGPANPMSGTGTSR